MLILSKYLRRNKALLAKLHSRLQPPLSKPHSKSCCPHPSHPYHASRASGWSEAVPVPRTHLLHSSTSAGWLQSDSSPGSSSPPARARGTRAACCLWLSLQPYQTLMICYWRKGARGEDLEMGAHGSWAPLLSETQLACISHSPLSSVPVFRYLLFILQFTVPICLQCLPYGLHHPTCKALRFPGTPHDG